MNQQVQHPFRSLLVLLWAAWLSYTCFKRAIFPPRDDLRWWHLESYVVNRSVFGRALNVLAGILVLAIVIGLIFGKG